jgi:type IV pilus assembly protein PilY1
MRPSNETGQPMFLKHAQRILTVAVAMSLASPGHAALGLMNTPPAAVIPPIPNVVVTLDDSGSMADAVDYEASINYVIPPNANGGSRSNGGGQPRAYSNGYADPQAALGNIDLSSAPVSDGFNTFRTAFQAIPASNAAARQNYANWFSYYRNRNMAMKASVMRAFAPNVVPDGRMRIAWHQLTTNCASFTNTSGCLNNRLKSFEGSHRTNLYNWVRGVPASGNTPLRAAHRRVGEYMRTTGVSGAYAFDPGTTESPVLSCRKSYHILFTDGGWNDNSTQFPATAGGNQDNTARTFPDGTPYTVTTPYRGRSDADGNNTLSDVAFNYWATDLQPTLINDVRTQIKAAGSETYGTTALTEYWNPKNNPANWQSLQLYAVGFGDAAELEPSGTITSADVPTFDTTTTGGADFASIVSGTRQWPRIPNETWRAWDLWHAAVNTRGEMFPAKTPDQLVNAFQKIVTEILANNGASGGATSSLAFTNDFVAVASGYEAGPWRGVLRGYPQANNKIDFSKPLYEAHIEMAKQNPNQRVVLTAASPTAGVPFRWSSLSGYQTDLLNRNGAYVTDSYGSLRVDYLRGSTANEPAGTVIPTPAFRQRSGSVLGTLVNSEPRLIGRPRSGFTEVGYKSFRDTNAGRKPIVYVGANDGMMHAFDAEKGQALLSFVPRGVFGRLSEYTDGSYQHKYYVDGPIVPGDAKVDGSWRTFLVGGLGAGGRGIYALDITDPSAFSESNASTLVKFDYTSPAEPLASTAPSANNAFNNEKGSGSLAALFNGDMGHIYGDSARDPTSGRSLQISKLKNGRWAFITGNGVNSTNERAVLFIVYLDAAGGVQTTAVETTTGQNNGLSVPLPVDVDGDGTVDRIYAGDLKGRLWRFDSNASGVFTVANGGLPLVDTGKPITSAPGVTRHPQGGLMVTVGTGRLYTIPDKTSTAVQTMYGVWDKVGVTGTVPLSDLAVRSLNTSATTAGGVGVRTFSSTNVKVNYATQRGWRIDLPVAGERVIFNPLMDGRIVVFGTYVPIEGQTCKEGGESGSLLAFDAISGDAPSSVYFDLNSDGSFDSGDYVNGQSGNTVAGLATGVGKPYGIIRSVRGGPINSDGSDAKNPANCTNPAGCSGGGGGGGGGGDPPPSKCVLGGTAGQTPDINCYPGDGRAGWRDLTP